MFYIKYLTNIRQLFHFSITAVAGCKFGQCRGEIFLAEFRPLLLDEQYFRVCSLPQEIVADTLFAGGADYQVRIRNSVGDQIFGKGRHISDFVNVFAGMLCRKFLRSLENIPLAAVAHEKNQVQCSILPWLFFQSPAEEPQADAQDFREHGNALRSS